MMQLHSYSKPLNLGHKDLPNFYGQTVVVQEKIDGSQISFGIRDGELFVCSRRRDIDLENPGMFAAGVAHIRAIQEQLQEGWTYRGEYLQKPKHNVLAYGRVPEHNIILFDVETAEGEFLNPQSLINIACLKELEVVPCHHQGPPPDYEQLMHLLSQESILGSVQVEGVVIKSYGQRDRNNNVVMAKLVSVDFREAHNKPKVPKVRAEVVSSILEGYNLEARWRKAMQHLAEADVLQGAPQDIGPLLRELQQDFEAEEKETLKELLYQHFRKQLLKEAVSGLPAWYKRQLAFGEDEHEC